MPKFKVDVPHELSADEAHDRLLRFSESMHAKYGDQVKDMHQSWEGKNLSFGFKTLGVRIDGSMAIEEDKVAVAGDLPFAAMMFKGKIESEIRQQLERLLRV